MVSIPSETRILVTGGTGFVGAHVVDALVAQGVRTRVLVRSTSDVSRLEALGVERVVGALEDPKTLERAVEGSDVVLHMAAATRARSEAAYHEANELGTARLVQAVSSSRLPPRRFVFLSSLAAVGPSDGRSPVRVNREPRPITAYGRSKLGGERAARAAAGPLDVTVLRAPAVYGPGDRDILLFFRLAHRGLLPIPTGGDRWLQLIHVADLVRGILHAVVAPVAGGVYYLADAKAYTWREVAEEVARAVGRRARAVPVPAPLVRLAAASSETLAGLLGTATIFNRDKAQELLAEGWLCDTEPARRDLGFETRIPLPEGLAATAEWYRARGWL